MFLTCTQCFCLNKIVSQHPLRPVSDWERPYRSEGITSKWRLTSRNGCLCGPFHGNWWYQLWLRVCTVIVTGQKGFSCRDGSPSVSQAGIKSISVMLWVGSVTSDTQYHVGYCCYFWREPSVLRVSRFWCVTLFSADGENFDKETIQPIVCPVYIFTCGHLCKRFTLFLGNPYSFYIFTILHWEHCQLWIQSRRCENWHVENPYVTRIKRCLIELDPSH